MYRKSPLRYQVVIFCLGALIACGKHVEKKPKPTDKISELKAEKALSIEKANSYTDKNGWVTPLDCDGMIWSAKLGAVRGWEGFKIEAAEYPNNPGKFGRRPPPWCWAEGNPEPQESSSEWSKDMAVMGLFPWAWVTKSLGILERHAAYGKEHSWYMGSPLSDGRTFYVPGTVGLLFNLIYALGGENSAHRYWPDIYPSGLDDYEAHAQVMNIYLRGEIATKIGDLDATPRKPEGQSLTIGNTMFDRLEEHSRRSPNTPFYAYVLGKYSGDQGHTIELLLSPERPAGEYVRCKPNKEACELAERLFVLDLLLKDFGE